LRLYLEDLCCDLCHFEHLSEGIPSQDIRIRREVDLGIPGTFADVSISLPEAKAYFVEIKWAYERQEIVDRIAHKYGSTAPLPEKAQKVRVVASGVDSDLAALESELRARVRPGLEVEVWTESRLRESILRNFRVDVKSFEREDLLALRAEIDRIKGQFAYGDGFTGSAAQATLMWHLGCWTIRRLRQETKLPLESIVRKGLYRDSAILIADLSSFSSYVRDSPDDSVIQNALASFYTKTRREVINCGGMMSQFVGDAVVAVFGVPVCFPDYIEKALECAESIRDIGKSVSLTWQSHIDRLQSAAGCHTGIAVGDLHLVPLRSYSHSHIGIVADAVNMAARLSSAAQPGEIVLSNAFYQRLGKASRMRFAETDPIEAKNVGRLQIWRSKPAANSVGV